MMGVLVSLVLVIIVFYVLVVIGVFMYYVLLDGIGFGISCFSFFGSLGEV